MKRTAEVKVSHFYPGVHLRLHFRSDLHLARKLWHMLMGLFIVFCYLSGTTQGTALVLLGSCLGLALIVESMRLRSPSMNEKMLKLWGPIMRQHEVTRMSTVTHYLSSVILAIAIFPKPVAVLSILYLACGDPIASLCGILYGNMSIRFKSGKSLIGSLAGTLVCGLLTLIYLKTLSISNGAVLAISLIGGLAGGLAELLPFEVDDNFSIPIVSGFVLWLAFMVIGL